MKEDNSMNSMTVWWDEELGIARAKPIGIINEERAKYVLRETERIAHQYGDYVDWLIDLSQVTKPDSKSRKILAEATGHPSIRKYAFAGASTFIRTVANFIVAASGQKNARHFATIEDALEWITDGR